MSVMDCNYTASGIVKNQEGGTQHGSGDQKVHCCIHKKRPYCFRTWTLLLDSRSMTARDVQSGAGIAWEVDVGAKKTNEDRDFNGMMTATAAP